MKGIELAEAYFEEYGRPMLERAFSGLLPYLAAGLFGSGSECFGYDDETSCDHDFEPGFCLLLPEEDVLDRRSEFLLERAYTKLPKEFRGFAREKLRPVGGARHGVLRTAELFQKMVGAPNGVLNWRQWLAIPEQALAEATNGKLFFDNWGEVSRIRETLAFFPEDIRRKRLAGQLLLAAQAGLYNYRRCLAHGERESAQLAVGEFSRSAIAAIFLINRRYRPYYKWTFRALRELPLLSELVQPLAWLLSTPNDGNLAEEKAETIERVAAALIAQLHTQGLTELDSDELERQAYAVNDGIRDSEIRNLHILAAV